MTNLKGATLRELERLTTPKMTKYITQTPTPKQAAFLLLDDCREVFYGGAVAGGKLLNVCHPILTEEGWKTIGTLTTDDRVVALDGSWSEIVYITPETLPSQAYEMTFSNGEKITCDAGHLWAVDRKRMTHINHRHKLVVERKVMSTQEIVDDGVLYKANNTMQKRYQLPQHYGIKGIHKELPINPYTLGLWLGDGTSAYGSITMGYKDATHLLQQLEQRGEAFTSYYDSQKGNCLTVQIEGLTIKLRENSLLNNKRIPLQYILADREQRIDLLKGLMDSDGHCQPRGRCEWAQKQDRQELFEDVCDLIASLGYKYSATVAPTTYKGKSFPSNRVTFTPREHVATVPRKIKNMFDDNAKNTNTVIHIERIEPVKSTPMKCIQINHSSKVFLVGKTFIPTHNSEALFMGAMQYVDVPGYRALLLRRTFQDLALPGALMDRAKEHFAPWVGKKEVHWIDKEKTFLFPSGATITFGYLETEKDKYRYASAEFQFVGFDELPQFLESQYTYLFSRLRRTKGVKVPIRMRSAGNPEGIGLEWVKQRFVVEGERKGRIFIPAKLEDNPYLDQEEYEESLAELDPITRERLRHGNWEIRAEGKLFNRDWFGKVQNHELPEYMRLVRYWDLAATEEKPGTDPDYTVGLLLGEHRGIYYVLDVRRFRLSPEATELKIIEAAMQDGVGVNIYIEEEPGSAGKHLIDHYARNVLTGYAVRGNRETGSKALRANPVSSAAERGNVHLLEAHWNNDLLDELLMFPTKAYHDDQVDALSGAFRMLKTGAFMEAAPIGVGDELSYWRALSS